MVPQQPHIYVPEEAIISAGLLEIAVGIASKRVLEEELLKGWIVFRMIVRPVHLDQTDKVFKLKVPAYVLR